MKNINEMYSSLYLKKTNSKSRYILIGFIIVFFLTLAGSTIEDLIHNVRPIESLRQFHHYILPIILGGVAGIFSFYYWAEKKRQIEFSKALHESEEKFKTIFFKNNSVCLLIEPGTGKVADANDAALDYYGYDYKEITSLNISQINILPNHEIESAINAAMDSKQKYFNFQHKLKSGEIRHVEVYTAPITVDKSSFLFSIIHDVTDRKHAEALNKMLKHSLDVYTDGIYWMDSDNRFVYVNEAGGKAFGCKPEDLLGKSLYDVNPTTTPETLDDLWHKLRTDGIFTAETVHRRFDGSEFFVEIRTVYFVYEGKEYNNGYARDITERKLVEKELIRAKEKAEESDRLKTAFLQNMSHEVRTPLNAIVGLSDLMISGVKTPEQLALYSEIISKSSEKLVGIITDVIEISQIQAKQLTAKLSDFKILTLFGDIEKKFSQLAKEKNIDLIFSKNGNADNLIVSSDYEKLNRILTHLVDNAIKFTIQGSVEVKYEVTENSMHFTISDTGIGIPDDLKDMIFEPFRQIEMSMTRNFGGNGLGLSIVKAFTDLLDGHLSLKSELNKGTVVSVSIPLGKTIDGKLIKPEKKLKKVIKTILIAEDEYSNYLYLSELLETAQVVILYAANGKQAIDFCKKNDAVDIILMDIKMPVMDGYTAAKLIKELRPDLPIVAQSAYALQSEIDLYKGVFDDYLTKPINKNVLMQKLGMVTDKSISK